MSSVVLNGDTSGAVTLSVPAVAGTNTVTIAAQTGTLNAAGPAFSAYNTAGQSTTANVAAKLQFNLETFDTNNCFDSTTNYRFTPTVAGYYQLNCLVFQGSINMQMILQLYKNGSLYQEMARQYTVSPNGSSNGSCLVYANGSTDYFEVYVVTSSNASLGAGAAPYFWFSGCLVRGA